jgi:putative protease
MTNHLDPEKIRIPAYQRKKAIVRQSRQKLILTALDRKQAGLNVHSNQALASVKSAKINEKAPAGASARSTKRAAGRQANEASFGPQQQHQPRRQSHREQLPQQPIIRQSNRQRFESPKNTFLNDLFRDEPEQQQTLRQQQPQRQARSQLRQPQPPASPQHSAQPRKRSKFLDRLFPLVTGDAAAELDEIETIDEFEAPEPLPLRRAAQTMRQTPHQAPPGFVKILPIGCITAYFDKIQVAVIKLEKPLRLGDIIQITAEGMLFQQPVDSMQINRKPVKIAKKGSEIGLKVSQEPELNGPVYKVQV